ncbi:MAG: metallophosphoesterase [Magnetococcus sp. YQC-5]
MKHTEFKWTVTALATLGLTLGTPLQGWTKDKSAEKGHETHHREMPPLGYVVLAEKGHALKGETVPVARLVLEHASGFSDATCPTLTMSSGQGTPIALITRPNPNPKEMPITICEAALPFARKYHLHGETWTVTGTDGKTFKIQLPTVSQAPETALILGDTGCRKNKDQTCEEDWPFPTVMAEQMAAQLKKQDKPAVIIHVGDLKYRGKNDDSNQMALKWNNWKADFFIPMSGSGHGPNLFAMAPWVIARGNHELCKSMGNNGEGWFYLLDPTSQVAGDSPQMVKDNSCQGVADGLTRPYRLDFANGLSLVVTDSAGLYEGKDVCSTHKQQLIDWYKEMAQNFKGSRQSAWLISHKPIWMAMGSCDKASFGNTTPQAALEALEHHALPEPFKLTLVGHKHIYISLDINPNDERRRMLELGVGNGGVTLNPKVYSGCVKHEATKESKAFQADVRGMSRFGFVTAELEVAKNGKSLEGWKLKSMALEKTHGPKWGDFKTAEVCEFPVKTGKPACEVKEKDFFEKACKSCDKVDGPDKQLKECRPGESVE